jgi:hypothetical protein
LDRLWAKVHIAWLTQESRAIVCPHDGTGDGCYGCAIMFGYGFSLPQAVLDQLDAQAANITR